MVTTPTSGCVMVRCWTESAVTVVLAVHAAYEAQDVINNDKFMIMQLLKQIGNNCFPSSEFDCLWLL